MTNLSKKLTAILATGSLVTQLVMAGPAFADTNVIISGNGSNSDNTVTATLTSTRTVVQSNSASIVNDVDASADTGNNDLKDNTGGDVSLETGDAETWVNIENTVNKNQASLDCCLSGDVDVLIEGNGTYSDNDANLKLTADTKLFQNNYAYIKNDVDADADTGDNDLNDNTGGNVSADTGNATTKVGVFTTANANGAVIGGGDSGDGLVSLKILENGSNSDNTINLGLAKSIYADQSNSLKLINDVDADSDTGNNDLKDNTGGEVSLTTGNAKTLVGIENKVNFNWLEVDCGDCLGDVETKIKGNGTYSDNDITLTLADKLDVFQDNVCGGRKEHWFEYEWSKRYGKPCLNDVYADADTGGNDLEDNTGEAGDDPSAETGDATSKTMIENSGNVNILGSMPEWWPTDWEWGFWLDL